MLFESLVIVFLVVTLIAYQNKDIWLATQSFLLSMAVFVLYIQHARVKQLQLFPKPIKPISEGFQNTAPPMTGDSKEATAQLTNSLEYANRMLAMLTATPSTTGTATTSAAPSTAQTAAPPAPPTPSKLVLDEIKPFMSMGLTMFFSSFLSTENNSVYSQRVWRNYVPPLPGCTDEANTHLIFDTVPSLGSRGFLLNQNKIKGPPSHMLGISGPNSFTFFMTLKFNDHRTSTLPIDFFRIYANTLTINGLSMTMGKDIALEKDGETMTMELSVKYGSKNVCTACMGGNNCGQYDVKGEEFTLPEVILNKKHVHTFLLIKRENMLHLIRLHNDTKIPLINQKLHHPEDVTFSNKEFEINPNGNLNAHIYMTGFFNRALSDAEVNRLGEYIKEYTDILDPEVTSFREKVEALEKEVQDLKKCPYNEDTCKSCTQIDNWAAPNTLATADKLCFSAIHKYCMATPTSPGCECWDPKHPRYNSEGCISTRRMYDNENYLDRNNLSSDDLAFVRDKYSVCQFKDATPPDAKTRTLSTDVPQEDVADVLKSTRTAIRINRDAFIDPVAVLEKRTTTQLFDPHDALHPLNALDPIPVEKKKGFWNWLFNA